MRDAYKKALQDPELQAKAEKLERPVDPAFGEDVLKMVQAALNQTPETVALLKEAMSAKGQSQVSDTECRVAGSASWSPVSGEMQGEVHEQRRALSVIQPEL